MTTADLIIFVVVLVAGVFLFKWGRRLGSSRKLRHESEALERIDRYLVSVEGDVGNYQFFTRGAQADSNWARVDLDTMKSEILRDCTTTNPDAFDYQKARFSVTSVQNPKAIYYVVGTNNYRFSIQQEPGF